MTVFGFDPRTSYTGSSTFWIRQSFFLPRYKTVLSAPRLNDNKSYQCPIAKSNRSQEQWRQEAVTGVVAGRVSNFLNILY